MTKYVRDNIIREMIVGGARVSVVPITAKVLKIQGHKAYQKNFSLVYTMGSSVAGYIVTSMVASVFLGMAP